MSPVAEQLHQAREARRLTVQQVAEITKIRTDHLRALEEGNFDVFSAPVYIRGFVRSYSTLLKLDVPQVMKALEAELAQTKKFAEPPSLSDHPRGALDFLTLQFSKVNWRRGVVVLGVAAVAGAVWLAVIVARHYEKSDRLKDIPRGIIQPTQQNSGLILQMPGSKR
jgi:cytoskeletal protein RodZ